jgi:hypothetical protein
VENMLLKMVKMSKNKIDVKKRNRRKEINKKIWIKSRDEKAKGDEKEREEKNRKRKNTNW